VFEYPVLVHGYDIDIDERRIDRSAGKGGRASQ
jgi:hypothetical protein